MSKYIKKPVEVEAVQFDGTDESVEWLLPQLKSGEIGRACNKLYIKTLEGVMEAKVGDYVIKGVNGEFYPCKPDIFEKTYEKIEDDDLLNEIAELKRQLDMSNEVIKYLANFIK